MPKSSRKRKFRSLTRSKSSTVTLAGRRTYVSEFIQVVTAYAMKNGLQEATAYFDVPTSTIARWVKEAKKINDTQITKALRTTNNPFRDTAYNIQRRMLLSDKLFSELEMTVEAERLKNDGFIPAHILSKLTSSFATLVDKRRLEEGAHTALVQEAKEPEAILLEGRERIVEFKRHFGLPELPNGERRKESIRE